MRSDSTSAWSYSPYLHKVLCQVKQNIFYLHSLWIQCPMSEEGRWCPCPHCSSTTLLGEKLWFKSMKVAEHKSLCFQQGLSLPVYDTHCKYCPYWLHFKVQLNSRLWVCLVNQGNPAMQKCLVFRCHPSILGGKVSQQKLGPVGCMWWHSFRLENTVLP